MDPKRILREETQAEDTRTPRRSGRPGGRAARRLMFCSGAGHRWSEAIGTGCTVLDITDPLNPVEVGSFDTTPYLSEGGFNGAWSSYRFSTAARRL